MGKGGIAITTTLVLLLATACQSGDGPVRTDGPIALGGQPGALCLPIGSGSQYTLGGDALHNSGNGSITITGVALVDAKDMKLVEAYVVPPPIPNTEGVRALIGSWNTYPPPSPAAARPEWHARQSAVGARVPPGDERGLVIAVAAAGPASLAKIQLNYTDDHDTKFVAYTSTSVAVKTSCAG